MSFPAEGLAERVCGEVEGENVDPMDRVDFMFLGDEARFVK